MKVSMKKPFRDFAARAFAAALTLIVGGLVAGRGEAQVPRSAMPYDIRSSDPAAEETIQWLDHGCAAAFGSRARVAAIMGSTGVRPLSASEVAGLGLPAGSMAWRFRARPDLAAAFLLSMTPNRICVVRVSRVDTAALQKATRELLDAWDLCCKSRHRIYDERDKPVPGREIRAHYVAYIIDREGAPYRYAVALTTIDAADVPWQAMISFNPVRDPY